MPNLFVRFFILLAASWVLAGEVLADRTQTEANRPTKTFVIAVHEWPPYASANSKYFGIIPRATTEILQSQGIEVKYRFIPWSEALDGVITEAFDAAIIWVPDDLHHETLLMSEPILNYPTALYFRKDLTAPASADDLLGYRIGMNPHYIYDSHSYRLMKEKFMIPIKGDKDLTHFRYLLNGTIDFYLTNLTTSVPLLKNNFSREEQNALTYSSNLFTFPSTHLVVNRHRAGSEAFITQFNAGLNRIKLDNTIDRYIHDFRFDVY